jgi:3-carboxy-cis,cis-muconate cycloisomerase
VQRCSTSSGACRAQARVGIFPPTPRRHRDVLSRRALRRRRDRRRGAQCGQPGDSARRRAHEKGRRRPSAGARGYVHWGATSQDILDTALVLQLRDALASSSAISHGSTMRWRCRPICTGQR